MEENSALIKIKVQPNGGQNRIVGTVNEAWKIKIAAPPEKGKANKELIKFLSEVLQLKKEQIVLIGGETSHNKVLKLAGLNKAEVDRLLGALTN
jgi:uncharacterized protein (TIGR00251 family)